MYRCVIIPLLCSTLLNAADSAAITIQVDQRIGTVNPWIYGQFLEHISYSADLGLHAELLGERSFEMPRSDIPAAWSQGARLRPGFDPEFPAFLWSATMRATTDPLAYRRVAGMATLPPPAIGYRLMDATTTAEAGVVAGQLGTVSKAARDLQAVNGKRYLRVEIATVLTRPEGIRQAFIPARVGQALDGFVYLRGQGAKGPVEVGLRHRSDGTIYASATITGLTEDWQQYHFTLTPTATDLDADFYLAAKDPGTYDVDLVSLMPLANRSGDPLRSDLVEACAALKPSIIRWPGGAFVHRYDWTAGVGPYEQRQPIRGASWGHGGETEPSTFGTDEFLGFCRRLGAEPLLVFNCEWSVQHCLDWIEYCNGPVTSPWGAKRAANGHPEPWKVTCWSIDNERWHMGPQRYSDLTKPIYDAIHQRYPDYRLWIVGTGQPLDMQGAHRRSFGPQVSRLLGDRGEFSSLHAYYGSGLAENLDLEDAITYEHAQLTAAGSKAVVALDEWMPGEALDLRGALLGGLMFNSLERSSAHVAMAAPAPWFWHQRLGTNWDRALIHHDHRGWFPTPIYVANQLWSSHRAPCLVAFTYTGPTLDLPRRRRTAEATVTETIEAVPTLDVVTTTDPTAGRTVLKLINRDLQRAVPTTITITGTTTPGSATAFIIHDPDVGCNNTLEKPDAVTIRSWPVAVQSGQWHLEVPAHAALVVEWKP